MWSFRPCAYALQKRTACSRCSPVQTPSSCARGTAAPQTDIALDEDLCAPLEPGAQIGTVTITGSSGDTLILPLIVPGGAARISTTHLWLQLLRAL